MCDSVRWRKSFTRVTENILQWDAWWNPQSLLTWLPKLAEANWGFWLGSLVRSCKGAAIPIKQRDELPQYRADQRPCQLCTVAPLQTSVLQHLIDQRRTEYLLQGVCYQSLLDLLERLDLCVVCNFSKSCSHWTEIDELRTSYFHVNICDSN